MWKQKNGQSGHAQYVWNKKQFDEVDPKSTEYLLGMNYCEVMFWFSRLDELLGQRSFVY